MATDKDQPSAERGASKGFMRKTFLANIEVVDKIESIAFWERLSIKDVVNDAFLDYIKKWEDKNGLVKLPSKK